jgi:hypothetical protein
MLIALLVILAVDLIVVAVSNGSPTNSRERFGFQVAMSTASVQRGSAVPAAGSATASGALQ